jgi:hypothetical protein
MWITPNYQDTCFSWPLSLDDKIKVFEDRVLGWQLGIANMCINGVAANGTVAQPVPHSGYAVLQIVLSYFEMITQFILGSAERGKSKHYFMEGVRSVFPELRNAPSDLVESLLEILYSYGRCGLYHSGMTGGRIILSGDPEMAFILDIQYKRLIINPHKLVPLLIEHLHTYCATLRDLDNADLRANFEKRFEAKMQ